MSLSSDDAAVLQTIGTDVVHSFVAVVVETFLIAIYSVMVFKTGMLLLRKYRTKVSICTCTAVMAMYAMALSLWMIDIHNVISEVQITLLATTADPLDVRYGLAVSRVLGLASVEDVLYAYMTVIGDGIIIWRVYAFWSRGRDKLVLIIPIAFLLGSIASSMTLTYCASRLGADIVLGTFQHPAFCRNIQTASYSTTLATTAVATILIAYKTWEYGRTYMKAFSTLSPRTRSQQIMLFLVETGVLYMLFFAVQVIVSTSSVNEKISEKPSLSFALTVYSFITSLIVGMYPTAVVLLVNSKHSVLNSYTTSGSNASRSLHTATATASGSATATAKRTAGGAAGSSPYLNTSSSLTTVPTRTLPPATAVDLYEMARVPSTGSGVEEAKDADGLVGRGARPLYDDVV